MPARRLPWVKLWPELMAREKVRQLTDSQYRTWTYCLLSSSQLPVRWRFDSLEHAAYVTRRPVKDIRALAEVHFLEQRDDGVWLHDVAEYQDVYPSDIERERSANTPPNPPQTPGEHSANGRPKTPRKVVNHSLETGDGRREIETGDGRPPPGEAPPSKSGAVIDAFRAVGFEPNLTARDHKALKGSTVEPGLLAECYVAVAEHQYGDEFMRRHLTIHDALEWINGYVVWRAAHAAPKQESIQEVPRSKPPAPVPCPECQRPIDARGAGHEQKPNLHKTPQEPDPLIACRLFGQPPSTWPRQRAHVA